MLFSEVMGCCKTKYVNDGNIYLPLWPLWVQTLAWKASRSGATVLPLHAAPFRLALQVVRPLPGLGFKIINLVVCCLNVYVGKERMLVFMSSSRLSCPKMRLPW